MSGKLIRTFLALSITVCLSTVLVQAGQSPAVASPSPTVRIPQLIAVNGTLKDRTGHPLNGVTGVRLALYRDQEGGAPTWIEIQNASLDEQGHYTVMLGAVAGLPLDLFASGEPRWLGVQAMVPGEGEQARLLFVSVPYALKSADADTLGGRPASAYRLRSEAGDGSSQTGSDPAVSSSKTQDPVFVSQANNGTVGYLGKFVNTVDLVNSNMFDSGGFVGIGTTTPGALFHVKGSPAPWTGEFVIEAGPTEVPSLSFMNGTVGGTNTMGLLKYDGAGKEFLFQNYNGGEGGNIRLQAGAGALFVANGGSTGIGTVTPAALLHIKGSPAPWTGNLVIEAGATEVPSLSFMNGSTGGANTMGLLKYDGAGKEFLFQNYNGGVGGSIRLQAGAGALFVANGGNVGIGNASPTAPLDVTGAVKASSTVSGSQFVSTAATGTAPLTVASSTVVPNLNASLLGGLAANAFAPASISPAALTRGVTYLAGCDTCSVLFDTDDQKAIYYNEIGAMTINSVRCLADGASTPTIHILRDDGSPANILPTPLLCDGNATSTFVSGETLLNLNQKLDFDLFVNGGAKRVTVIIKMTVN